MNHPKNIFINSGIRAKIDHAILQSNSIKTLGYAIGYLLAEEFEMSCPILIATDTRTSGQRIKKDLIEGLVGFDHDVFDAGICPTPFVAKALKDYQPEDDEDVEPSDEDESFFTLGIVITASHNTAEFNGIKILTPFGYLDEETEEEISEIYHTFSQNRSLITDSLPDEPGNVLDIDLVSWYQAAVLDVIDAKNKKCSVLLDCSFGATAQIASQIFASCGFSVVTINNERSGEKINQHSGCSNPQLLLDAMKKFGTDWGCAFDGDGDRVIIAHRDGTIFDGDDIIAILALHERYQQDSVVVGTIMTNAGLQKHFEKNRKKLIRTPVGERNLISALIKHQAFLGAETCGHVIMMDHAFCSDGIFTALEFLTMVTQNPTLIEAPYQKYIQKHQTIPFKNQKIDQKLIEDYEKNYACRIIIRPSNTEPILRIMVESIDEKTAQNVLDLLMQELR